MPDDTIEELNRDKKNVLIWLPTKWASADRWRSGEYVVAKQYYGQKWDAEKHAKTCNYSLAKIYKEVAEKAQEMKKKRQPADEKGVSSATGSERTAELFWVTLGA